MNVFSLLKRLSGFKNLPMLILTLIIFFKLNFKVYTQKLFKKLRLYVQLTRIIKTSKSKSDTNYIQILMTYKENI